MLQFVTIVTVTLAAVMSVLGERHTVHFDNRCGYGTPKLIQGGRVLSTGGDYTVNAPLRAAIAYLDTGRCGFNGEGCTLVELTLVNPTSPGSGSSADISLIPPLAYSQPAGFGYYNGCNGAGANCANSRCDTAFRTPTDTWVQVACQTNDVNLAVTFC